nr:MULTISPECIES: SDR family NAD(P)-dependent oxidoreductase [unclassified Bradyrhizobium]
MVIGASAGVGRALCEALAARGTALLLVARDAQDLDALAAHLRLVHGVEVRRVATDASVPSVCVEQIAAAASQFGEIDGLYFPIGASQPDDLGLLNAQDTLRIVNSNLTVVMAVTAHLLPQLLQQKRARIVGFGSIAAVRGRRANVVYSAAKRGLESYFESLRHLTVGGGVLVQFFRLGYVETQQSFGKRLLFPIVSPARVADYVMANADNDIGAVFFPRFWAGVALAISRLPWLIFKKLNF